MQKALLIAALTLQASGAITKDGAKVDDGSTCSSACKGWEKCFETVCKPFQRPCTFLVSDSKLTTDCDYAGGDSCVKNPAATVSGGGTGASADFICKTAAERSTGCAACTAAQFCTKLGTCKNLPAEIQKLPADTKAELGKTSVDATQLTKVRKLEGTTKSAVAGDHATSRETISGSGTDIVPSEDGEVIKIDKDGLTLGTFKTSVSTTPLTNGGVLNVDDGGDLAIATKLEYGVDNYATVVGKGSKITAAAVEVKAGRKTEMVFGDKVKLTELDDVTLGDKDARLTLSGGKVKFTSSAADKAKGKSSQGTLRLSGGTELTGDVGKTKLEVFEVEGAEDKAEVGADLIVEGDILGTGTVAIKGAGKKLTMKGAKAILGPKLEVEAGGEFISEADELEADVVKLKGKFTVKLTEGTNDLGKNFVDDIEECTGEVVLDMASATFEATKSKTVFAYNSAKTTSAKISAFTCPVKVKMGTTVKTATKKAAFSSSDVAAKSWSRRLLQTNDCVEAVWGADSLEVAAGPCPTTSSAATPVISAAAVALLAVANFV